MSSRVEMDGFFEMHVSGATAPQRAAVHWAGESSTKKFQRIARNPLESLVSRESKEIQAFPSPESASISPRIKTIQGFPNLAKVFQIWAERGSDLTVRICY